MQPAAGRRQLQHPGVSALDRFPDGAFVGLQNRALETYLHADEDGEGVSLCPHGAPFPLNAVWRVQHVFVGGTTFLLLQGARYGRYLATAPQPQRAPSAYRGRLAVQRDYGGANVGGALMWRPFRMVDDEEEGYIRLRHDYNINLRANGRFRFWLNGVTVDSILGSSTTMMQWTVRTFQTAPALPPIPHPTVILGPPRGLFRRRSREADERRTIRHVRVDDEGHFNNLNYDDDWPSFHFYGRSVFNLRTQVGIRQPDGEVLGLTLAVRPGLHGRLTPLVTDLPHSVDPMDIVVFRTGSQGAQGLVYPNIV